MPSFSSRDPDDFQVPLNFASWGEEGRVEYLRLSVSRADLLALLRGFIGSDRSGDRVNKFELALIVDILKAWR